jgi:tRNA pseudouridine38-40 synthase
MIRIIVYKLLQIGEGQFGIEEFEHYLSSGETIKTIKPAYPQGLYLSKVVYPFLDLPSRTQFLNPVLHEAGDWLIV